MELWSFTVSQQHLSIIVLIRTWSGCTTPACDFTWCTKHLFSDHNFTVVVTNLLKNIINQKYSTAAFRINAFASLVQQLPHFLPFGLHSVYVWKQKSSKIKINSGRPGNMTWLWNTQEGWCLTTNLCAINLRTSFLLLILHLKNTLGPAQW